MSLQKAMTEKFGKISGNGNYCNIFYFHNSLAFSLFEAKNVTVLSSVKDVVFSVAMWKNASTI